jgi:hypothetical protein
MRTAAALICLFILANAMTGPAAAQNQRATASAASGDTYLTVHNVRPAHGITLGAGAKVGILDHSFGMDAHPELYAGGEDFLDEASGPGDEKETHHGYWMALTLHEIAPEAEIFALATHTLDEAARVEAMIQALDWAVENELDVVTYCAGVFSEAAQKTLDPVVERTVKAGVVVVFVDYSHPLNLLPGVFGPPVKDGLRDPDLNIFSYDCTDLLADRFVALVDSDDDGIQKYRPFLARPATGPVTAGFVALMRSVDPEASPVEIKRILMETSRPMPYRGRLASRVPDALEAVTNIMGVSPAQ